MPRKMKIMSKEISSVPVATETPTAAKAKTVKSWATAHPALFDSSFKI